MNDALTAVFMPRALDLAQGAIGLSEPNPRVGCVITTADGAQVLGEGHTQAAGSAHAEVMALRDAAARGADVRGATAYVTLEPCSHHGRTPPCCDALIAAGLQRVVIAAADPNPLVNGQGAARLRAAGVVVDWADATWASRCRELNIGFFSRMERQRPWLRLKMAASLDGRTALDNGVSQWITGAAARQDGHLWRRRAGAVLTGIGTVLADNPRLDVRGVATARQPLRVVLDSQLHTPPQARLFEVAGPVLLYAAQADPARVDALQQRGAEVVVLPGEGGRVDLGAVLADLAQRQVNELHIEAGARLNAAWQRSGWVDEWLVYLAPMLIGPGRGLVDGPPLRALQDAPRYRLHEVCTMGEDVRLRARQV